MGFKKFAPPPRIPDSPDKILQDLPRRKIPGPLDYQGEILKQYAKEVEGESDVALQLPTGSGKTLVGLLIGEWRRLKNQERVLYLCPTNQLVNQIVEQANSQYGLSVYGFTGKKIDYDPIAKAAYMDASAMAITTYSALFNVKPFFHNPQFIIVDDAHVAENYFSSFWSLEISRLKHPLLHSAIAGVLRPIIEPHEYARLIKQPEGITDLAWVDKIPTPQLELIHDELFSVIEAYIKSDLDNNLPYVWSNIKNHLLASHLYISTKDILIRPLLAPTWDHPPFENARQRLFMSATLGAGGDLERITGREKITRLTVPNGWDQHGVGRRFFIFPSLSLREDEENNLMYSLMKHAGRSVVLVTSTEEANKKEKLISDAIGCAVYHATELEKSKSDFIAEKQAVAIIANRYDGIDFPNDSCRLLFVVGLPRSTNSQEMFLMSRMGANILYNERVQTRILQAIGRCTRASQDYSAVVITGESLVKHLNDSQKRTYFHPELQAELEFGILQSKDMNEDELLGNFKIFLKNDREWEEANKEIISKREMAVQKDMPAISELAKVVDEEIRYQKSMWKKDYLDAYGHAEKVLSLLTLPELRGYRAMWHYLAGSAAWLEGKKEKAIKQFKKAKGATNGIYWLVNLSQYDIAENENEQGADYTSKQVENIENIIDKLGILHSYEYDKFECEIRSGLSSSTKGEFENAHCKLGKLLGFEAGYVESEGSPDSWWICGKVCFVFEDHANAKDTSPLSTTKARQAASHPNWIRGNVEGAKELTITPVIVSPVKKASDSAIHQLTDVAFWLLEDFKKWAENALSVIREQRGKFNEVGDLVWRSEMADALKQHKLDASSLYSKLKNQNASEFLK